MRCGAPVTLPGEGEEVGPFRALATPGHSADSVCLLAGRGSASPGTPCSAAGSVFISPGEGSLAAYLRVAAAPARAGSRGALPGPRPLRVGPAGQARPSTSSTGWTASAGCSRRWTTARRSAGELLDAAWADAPAHLRPAAALSLAAHLEKLEDEGRLPADVEWPLSGGGGL